MLKLSDFLTEKDDSLAKDSFRDPLGTQVIWSYFGQELFGQMVTTIANDIRNYSINLFNHWVIKQLMEDTSFQLKGKARDIFGDKRSREFQRALVVFFENLIVYSILINPKENLIRTNLLGGLNAGSRIEESHENPMLVLDQNAGILVRQYSLGINGRYKGPFLKMGFFENNGNYLDAFPEERLKKLFPKLSDLLKETLYEILKSENYGSLNDFRAFPELQPNTPYFQLPYQELEHKKELQKYCQQYFSDYTVVLELEEFWKGKLNFDQEPQKSIYDDLEDGYSVGSALNAPQYNDYPEIRHIRTIEPILTILSFLFEAMLHKDVQGSEDLEKLLNEKGYTDSLANLDQSLTAAQVIIQGAVQNPTVKRRLEEIIAIFQDRTMDSMTKECIEYHKRIVSERQLPAWISLENGRLKKLSGIRINQSINAYDHNNWSNDYYFRTVLNIKNGLQGEIS